MTKPYRGELGIMERLSQNGPLPSLNRICQDRRDALAEIERLRADNERLLTILGAATMAKNRLNTFADQANAGQVQYSARELSRKIWGAFSDFDAALNHQQSPQEK